MQMKSNSDVRYSSNPEIDTIVSYEAISKFMNNRVSTFVAYELFSRRVDVEPLNAVNSLLSVALFVCMYVCMSESVRTYFNGWLTKFVKHFPYTPCSEKNDRYNVPSLMLFGKNYDNVFQLLVRIL